MPLPSQQGELANRLRNFFLLTGRIPSSLDEVTVPTASVVNLDQAPYRQSPILGGFHNSQPAVVGENSIVGVGLPNAAKGGMKLIQATANNGTTAAASQVSLYVVRYAGLIAAGIVDGGPIERLESMSQSKLIGNVSDPAGPHQLLGSDTAAVLGFEIDRQTMCAITAGGSPNAIFTLPIFVPAGGAIYLFRRTPNEALNAAFAVEYYPDHQPLDPLSL